MTLPLAGIEGKYEILAKLSEGGMGAIYQVRHRLLDEVRVVKVLRPQHEGDEELRARFAREARAAIKLRHPNTVQIFDFSVDERGAGLIVMEHIHGIDLQRIIDGGHRPSLALGLEIARQGLRALGYLHRAGYVHRDVSPDNLMLTLDVDRDPLIKLIDLGIAKRVDSKQQLTVSGSFLGKFRYASPEHFSAERGSGVDARSDLYTFALVLYQLLTGVYPMPGDSTSQLIAAHLFQPPTPFETSDPEGQVPEPVRAMLLRALQKDPDERYPDARTWIDEIRRLQREIALDEASLSEARSMVEDAPRAAETRGPSGSTQRRLDRHFGLETTPRPGTLAEAADQARALPAHDPAAALLAGADALFQLGQLDPARQQVETLLQLEPDNRQAHELLARIAAGPDADDPLAASGDLAAEVVADAEARTAAEQESEAADDRHETRAAEPDEAEPDKAGDEDDETLPSARTAAVEARDPTPPPPPPPAQAPATTPTTQASGPTADDLAAVTSALTAGRLIDADRKLYQLREDYGPSPRLDALGRQLDTHHQRSLERQIRAHLDEADRRVERGEYPAALELLRKAQAMTPSEGALRAELAEGIIRLHRTVKARERQRAVDEIERHVLRLLDEGNTDDASEQVVRARATYGAHETFESLDSLIGKAQHEQLAALVNEAGLALEAKRYKTAVRFLEQVLSIDPGNEWVAQQLERVRADYAAQRRDFEAIDTALAARDLAAAATAIDRAAATWGESAVARHRTRFERVRKQQTRRLLDQAEEAQAADDLVKAKLLAVHAREISPDDTAVRHFALLLDSAAEQTHPDAAPVTDGEGGLLHTVAEIEKLRVDGEPLRAWKATQQAIERFGEVDTLVELRRTLAESILDET
ncbi:MAG: protein kinase [Acidobacteriota bacterium]